MDYFAFPTVGRHRYRKPTPKLHPRDCFRQNTSTAKQLYDDSFDTAYRMNAAGIQCHPKRLRRKPLPTIDCNDKNRRMNKTSNDKKATINKHPRAQPSASFWTRDDGTFFANKHRFAATIYGPPRPYKRPGFGIANSKRYNPNKADQLAFIKALQEVYSHSDPSSYFESAELQITAFFSVSRNADIDNLLKFLLDALQLAKLYNNDMQVTKISAEKRFVDNPKDVPRTYFIVEKRIIEID
jgi:Holliday junction resolvase RusA-like endonuclease